MRHVVRVVRNDLPAGRVLDRDAFHADVLAVVEDDEARTKLDGPDYAGATRRPRLSPPALAVAVDGAFAGDRDLLGVRGADERLRSGRAELGLGRVVGMIRRAEQRCAFGDVESDVALEHDGAGEKGAAGELDRSAPAWRSRRSRPESPWCPWSHRRPWLRRFARRRPCPLPLREGS